MSPLFVAQAVHVSDVLSEQVYLCDSVVFLWTHSVGISTSREDGRVFRQFVVFFCELNSENLNSVNNLSLKDLSLRFSHMEHSRDMKKYCTELKRTEFFLKFCFYFD